ncbi:MULTISPECIES: FecR domain-containing protein [unclassified Sphingomonas]|uniref:FecR family protein n=1 Tax=unclassified Sphingomonas TaxID=196159 RepID=UPI000FF33C38|nr:MULTISPECIES: FecR domain-containing protein [unclassified Sphingomonas]RKE53979.1 FecR family protein [Sphingomonas sp. PP-CC-1A-547]TCM10522.1 FecR family protein [Sphingomonas sp. PP-CC-3G-468]
MAEHDDIEERTLNEAALDWVVRTGSDAFDDWPAFHAWLEADPRHAAAYHAMSMDIEEMAAAVPPVQAAPIVMQPARRRWPVWAGGAIAASLALFVGYEAIETRAHPYAVETAAGTMRTVRLADGSTIAMGGATRLMLDRDDPRVATLERGEAMFVIRHDDSDPFEVSVGGARLVDVGTAFDVKFARAETRVAVSEGAVDYNPGQGGIRLVKGQGLVVRDGKATVTAVDVASVGSWRDSVLAYEGATLAEVADDLSRALGVDLRADPGVAKRAFSGSIATAKLSGDPRLAAPLLGVAIRKRGGHWVMSSRS